MKFLKARTAFLLLCLLGVALAKSKSARFLGGRVHLPWLGIGPSCTSCPQHYCDDDPAIIHGYCCGCARYYDRLPVSCPPFLDCPVNNYNLCEDYEYMMHCCCS